MQRFNNYAEAYVYSVSDTLQRNNSVCPHGYVCVTYVKVGGDQSPVSCCRRRRTGVFDGSASPTLGMLRSYTDGVINRR